MSKIQITTIEHIDWAKRLLIHYTLSQDCFNPAVGGWEYSLQYCGYRSITNDQWVNLVPNAQHPQHSSIIRYAGNYTFVWDYLDVPWLSPTDFDSNHSYLIQLVLVDTTCDYVDPCADTGYITPSGDQPTGTPGTPGDVNNTNNNCGPGYILLSDSNGCLYCATDSPGGSTNPPGDDNSVVTFSQDHDPVITSDETSGDADPIGDPAVPPIDDEGPIIGDPDADPPTTGDPVEPNDPGGNPDGSDVPDVTVLTSGPYPPIGDGAYEPRPTNEPYGSADTSIVPDSYSYEHGYFPNNNMTYGPGAPVINRIIGTTYGGRTADVNFIRRFSSMISEFAKEMISPDNASLNERRSADQLNLNTVSHLISDTTKNIINRTPFLDNIRQSTKVVPSIFTQNDKVFINKRNSLKEAANTNDLSFVKDTENIVETKAIRKIDAKDSKASVNSNINSDYISSSSTVMVPHEAGDRSSVRAYKSIVGNLPPLGIDPEFYSGHEIVFFVRSVARAGDGLFCEVNVSPKYDLEYKFKVIVYIRGDNKTIKASESGFVKRKGPIKIATKLSTVLGAGEYEVIVVVYNSKLKPIATVAKNVLITDAAARRGLAIGEPVSTVSFNNSAMSLVLQQKAIEFPIGPPTYRVGFRLKTSIVGTNVPLTILLKSDNPLVECAMSVFDKYTPSSRVEDVLNKEVVGKRKSGLSSPFGNYSCLLQTTVDTSAFTANSFIYLAVSSITRVSSMISMYLNKTFNLAPMAVTGRGVNGPNWQVQINRPPLVHTKAIYFRTGGNGIIPDNVSVKTGNFDESVIRISFPLPAIERGWVGLGLRYPANMPLGKRILWYIKEKE